MFNSLLFNRNAHLKLAHVLNVFQFIIFSDCNISAILNQFTNFGDAKFLNFQAECQIVAECVDVIFNQIHQALIESVIFALHVRVFHLNAENVLVKCACEVAFEKFVVVNCFRCWTRK